MADAKLYSNLYGSATILPHPDLAYATLRATLDGAANADDYKEAMLRVRDSLIMGANAIHRFLSRTDVRDSMTSES